MSQAIAAKAPITDNLRGIIYMIIAMACFTVGDLCVKVASQELPSGQVMIALGLGCTIVFGFMLIRSGEPMWSKAFFERPVMLRNVGEVIGSYGMFMSLAFLPLSTVTAITQTLPLLLTLAAALFLGEKVGIHRITAVVIGFLGSLVVIRPGMGGFDYYTLLTMLAVCGMAMRDIGGRLTRRSISSLLLSFYSAITLLTSGIFLLMLSGGAKMPTQTTWFYLLGLVAAASLGLIVATQAVRIGELSVVAPFRYIRIVFAVLLGIFFLDEVIDTYTIIGSAITILAGIYIWVRENRIAAKTTKQP
jgi:drug/metabolite transporter (DMT)-like permease